MFVTHSALRTSDPEFQSASPPVPATDVHVNASPFSDESAWRTLDAVDAARLSANEIVMSRWRSETVRSSVEHSARTDTHHVIAIYLKETVLSYASNGGATQKRKVAAGAVQVTLPEMTMACRFHEPADVLHLHVPNADVERCFTSAFGHAYQGRLEIRHPHPYFDAAVRNLSLALVNAAQSCGVFAKPYTDGLVQAIVGRLLALQFKEPMSSADSTAIGGEEQRKITHPLIAWRLKKTTEYVQSHLESVLSLPVLAQIAGLSPMYFASQFRAATGMTPHNFVLLKRIEAARRMLTQNGARSIDVALQTGFRSQAHFTMVFKKITGTTPARWQASAAGDLP